MKNRRNCAGVPVFSSIRLKNFKAYKDTGDIPFAPFTIIVGANNSGKSSLLQGALVLAQSMDETAANRALVTSGQLVQLNGFFDIVHRNGMAQKSFMISLTINDQVAEFVRQYVYGATEGEILGNKLEVSFRLNSRTKEIEVKKSTYWVGINKLLEIDSDGKGSSEVFRDIRTDLVEYRLLNFMPTMGWHAPPKGKAGEKGLRLFGKSVGLTNYVWRFALGNVFRAGPLRIRVPWYSGVGATSTSEFGLGGENLIAELGSHESPQQSGRKPLVDEVNRWLSGKLGMPDKVRVEGIDKSGTVRSLFCDELQGAKNINAAAMGEGVSQVLPIISRAFAGSPVECLFVEQPEIHLHPALQADLADLFIDIVQRHMKQVILETHSEHLILRLRRRIAEQKIDPNMVSILYVERTGSESSVRVLNLNERGHFTNWPKGFFDEAYQEAMALAMASSSKGK